MESGVISRLAQGMARIEGKLQAEVAVPITGAAADDGNRVNNGHNVSDYGENHNHIKEVIHHNNHQHGFPVVTGRLEQPVNGQ